MPKKIRRSPPAVAATARARVVPKVRARKGAKAPVRQPARRRRLSAEDARKSILDAAEELLISSGPDALRLMDIATHVGVAHANISYHFGNVAGLQTQLAQRIAEGLADEIAGVYRTDEGRLPPFERTVARTFEVYGERGYARLVAWLALAGEKPTFEQLGAKLKLLCAAIAAHPGLAGPELAERRRRYIIPSVQLTILAAVGSGLIGRTLDSLFGADSKRATVVELLGEVFTSLAGSTG